MRKYTVTICLLFVFVTISMAQQPVYTNTEFKPLHGLTGLWKMDSKRGALYEEWQVSGDNQLTGRSYKISNNDTIVLENVVISLQGNAIFYTPVVRDQNNQQPVPFKLISYNNNRYVFENKEHDYPQRVIYELISSNEIRARIEGNKNGKESGSDFNYTRLK
ncbi:DUF6265 family protein [Niastella sp. OAS944]|uniref:DUF6265 family protein n=1 Tax=Niastella sp. OAS944 TaxID=2664089 RepID=UPI003494081D|nr:hypothetical protein [Chitinophagaceae bacterium OAS944]